MGHELGFLKNLLLVQYSPQIFISYRFRRVRLVYFSNNIPKTNYNLTSQWL